MQCHSEIFTQAAHCPFVCRGHPFVHLSRDEGVCWVVALSWQKPSPLRAPALPQPCWNQRTWQGCSWEKLVNLCFIFFLHFFSWRCEQIMKLLKKKGSVQEGGRTIGPWSYRIGIISRDSELEVLNIHSHDCAWSGEISFLDTMNRVSRHLETLGCLQSLVRGDNKGRDFLLHLPHQPPKPHHCTLHAHNLILQNVNKTTKFKKLDFSHFTVPWAFWVHRIFSPKLIFSFNVHSLITKHF